MSVPYRHAIFACPPRDDPLTALAARWLGRDAWSGGSVVQPGIEGIADATTFPRRYGFHATIVAPFRAADGTGAEEIDATLDAFAAGEAPIALPLRIERLGAFLALAPAEPSEALDAMAARAVRAFHPLCAAPTPDEFARRHPDRLTERQRGHLARWHYPYVMDEFRYHMTLTGPLRGEEVDRLRRAAEAHFPAGVLAAHTLDGLARYAEPAPGAPFTLARRAPLAGEYWSGGSATARP